MIPQNRKYFVIIVHHGNPQHTNVAITSLTSGRKAPHGIMVVNNGDKPYNVPATDHIWIVRPPRNYGYAAGLNVGLGALLAHGVTEHDIVVCMNNNIEVQADTLYKLARWWQTHPRPSFAGVMVKEGPGTVPGLGYINLLTGRSQLYRKPKKTTSTSHSWLRMAHLATQMPYVHGAFFAAPYGAFMETKGIPDHYFLYWEDALLSTRARRRGIPLQVARQVGVLHRRHQDSRNQTDRLYYLVRNGALFLEQETAWPWRRYWWLANRLRLMYHTARPHANPAVRQALLDVIHNISGPRSPKHAIRDRHTRI